jgi:H+/Cl- antiporter ClcA
MKKLIIGALLLLSMETYGQTSTVETVIEKAGAVIDSGKQAVKDGVKVIDTSSNFKRIYGDIKDGISAIASGLKVGAEHVYVILIKQQIVASITGLLSIIVCIIIIYFLFKYAQKLYIKGVERASQTTYGSWDDNASGASAIILYISGGLLLIGTFVFTMTSIEDIVTGFVNPEYGAINEIIDFVKRK